MDSDFIALGLIIIFILAISYAIPKDEEETPKEDPYMHRG